MNYPSIEQVAEIATEAAKLVMDYYNGPMLEAFRKEDNSPVTEADKNASDLIINRLKAISDLPVVSEEEDEKYNLSVIQSASEYWLVDPIDGTWSFINRAGDFTVNIALIKDGAPIMGVVHAPLTDICYCGTVGEGAYKIENGQKIIMSPRIVNADEGYDFLVSSQNLNQRMQDFLALYDVKTITPIPSSVKFALIADGQGDIYPRFKKTSIWDTGAGHAILKAIGGEVLQLDGKPLVYNQGIINPNFVAISSTKISLPAIEDFTVFPW